MTADIVRLTAANIAVLDRIAPDVFDEPINPARLAAYAAEPGHLMLLAVADGEVVAQVAAVIHRHPDKVTELYVDEVGVTPAFQRQGLATRMMDEMFALGREFGCSEAWVGTEPDNVAANGLYAARRPAEVSPFTMYLYEL